MNTPSNASAVNALSAFISALVWATGTFCLIWAIDAWKCMTMFIPVDFLLWKDAYYSEGLIFTLLLMPLPLGALHALMHLHQRHATDGERFPGRLGSLDIPAALRLMRVGLFGVLVFFPTFTYAYVAGRVFDQFTIEWRAELAPENPSPRPSAKAGWKLLTDWGGKRPDGRKTWSFSEGWVWHAWQDNRPAFAARSVRTTAWPGVQPTLFLLCAIGGTISLGWLMFRPMRTPDSDDFEI